MSDSCGLVMNVLLLICELLFHAMIFLFLPYGNGYDIYYNGKLENAILSFSIINSLVAIISLILIFSVCCCSNNEDILIIFIIIKLFFTIIEFGLNLGIIGEIKKIEKKYNIEASNSYSGAFMAVLGFLIGSLITNIIELIICLSCIGKCHCCNCGCCYKHYNNSIYKMPNKKKEETGGNRETERGAVIIIQKVERRIEGRIDIEFNRNNFV